MKKVILALCTLFLFDVNGMDLDLKRSSSEDNEMFAAFMRILTEEKKKKDSSLTCDQQNSISDEQDTANKKKNVGLLLLQEARNRSLDNHIKYLKEKNKKTSKKSKIPGRKSD